MNEATIQILKPDASQCEARVEWWSPEHTDCRVRVTFEDQTFEGSGGDFFDALADLRNGCEGDGYRLLCYGASRNVWPSGMARDMGRGLKAYRNQLNQRASRTDLVGIFETGADVEPGTVAEQRAFHEEWILSLRT